jgi:DNA-binding GntR family transcriptional regulator
MAERKVLRASLEGLDPVDRISYRHVVRDRLREAILTGELTPGQRLNEVAVAKQLGVSPTPVREAFRDLEHAGLIEVNPRRGAVVKAMTHRDLAEMYSLRSHLERLAVRLAHPRLTEEDFGQLEDLIRKMEETAQEGEAAAMVEVDVAFHRHIVASADHSLLLQTWERINPSQWTYLTVRMLVAAKGPVYIARRHWPLLAALRAKSVEAAEAAIADHIDVIGVEALDVFDSMHAPPREQSNNSRA